MNDKPKGIFGRASKFWADVCDNYDLDALPAFLIFLVVVTLGMFMNFLAMRHTIGDIPAILVSGLFEFGILAWKWTSNRKRNNDDQDDYVNWATWVSVFLAVAMLIINLFRTSIENSLTAEPVYGVTLNGWQVAAYITIGLAALTHIVFYLMFDHADTDKAYLRRNKRSQHDIAQRSREADDIMANTEADLKIIQKITIEIGRLRDLYKNIPMQQREIVLENARQELLSKYKASKLVEKATAGLPDLDGDGVIGGGEKYADPTNRSSKQTHTISGGNGSGSPFS